MVSCSSPCCASGFFSPLLHVHKHNKHGKSRHSDNLAGTCWVQKRRHEGQEEEADGHKHKSKKVRS